MHAFRLLALCLVIPLLVNCAGNRGSNGLDRSDRTSGSLGEALDPNADAEFNTVRNARIILYQPLNRQRMIIVNHDHQLRSSVEGRRRLALGQRGQGYKVLSDKQIDALLESMKASNEALLREPASADDFKYLKVEPGQVSGFKGIVLVENNGQISKYVGWRPGDDPVKGERYRTFVKLKTLVAKWHGANSQIELPSPAMRGGSDPTQFNVERSSRAPSNFNR